MGVMKTCGSFSELKRPEAVFKLFIRFALAKAAISYCLEILSALFKIAQGVVNTIMGASGFGHTASMTLPEQMTEIYRCCADSVDGEFFELTDKQEEVIRSVQQQIEVCVQDLNERIRQQEEALEQASQEQTM